MNPLRILYVNGGIMNRGGIESYMMNYYRNLDRNKIQIDFIVHGYKKGEFDDEIINLGGKIYNIPVKSKDYLGNIRALKDIFLSGRYKIVHSHMDAMSLIVLREAKKCGVPIRIAHSHNTQHLTNNRVKILLNEYARKNLHRYATHFFACSQLAGLWLFGAKKFEIINNAIELEKFYFDENKRKFWRRELGLENEFVIGHVGRFDYQKNHIFLLSIFKEVRDKIPNSKLILIGDGHLRQDIINKIRELNLIDSVIMLGVRSNVYELNNVFDLFILPSLFEGLPVAAIEAQANGLPCLLSENITKEVGVSKNTYFISNSRPSLEWASKIEEISKSAKRNIVKNKCLELEYCIEKKAKDLQEIYLSMVEEDIL